MVWRGENPVPGAVVHVAPWEGFSTGKGGLDATTITNAGGFFGGLRWTSLRFDLTARLDRDVMVFRGLGYRYVNAVLEDDARTLSRAWSTRLDVQIVPPPAGDRAVAFFATGSDRVFGVSGDLEHGVSLVARDFTSTATLHAVEYDKAGGLRAATAYGKAEVVAIAGSPPLVQVRLEPITKFVEPTITIVPPPNRPTPATAELILAFSRTSTAPLGRVPLGVKTKLPFIPNHAYVAYRIVASWEGAVSDSGEVGFDIQAEETKAALPETPTADVPLDGAAITTTERFSASGKGVMEHVLAPVDGGSTIRIITKPGEAALPDLASIGAPTPSGAYSWTVRSFPKLTFVDQLAGLDTRRYNMSGSSKPRIVVFP